MSRILVINSGSSSIKFKLFGFPGGIEEAHGSVERIGEDSSVTKIVSGERDMTLSGEVRDHEKALESISSILSRMGLVESFAELDGVGHRVVHGAERFRDAILIDDDVIEAIRDTIPLAPLHNPANLEGIEMMKRVAPNLPQVAVFDTAFHSDMPPSSYLYALPKELYEKYGIRRYGFHGTSHAYVSHRASRLMGKSPEEFRCITLHLGNGASLCAVRDGKSLATSMGFTPLEGLVMGTRCGDIDPSIPLYLEKSAKMDMGEIDTLLNKRSGLKGICGINDMREIESAMQRGDEEATLAFELFINGVVKYIGYYALLLERVDALVFTGGIGEHSDRVRKAICSRLGILGIYASDETLSEKKGEFSFHSPESESSLWVIPTDEEGFIARQTVSILSGYERDGRA